MCFSNLPVEFDEDGDPYLADEADDVAQPDGDGEIPHPSEDEQVGVVADGSEYARDADADDTIDAAPEEAYDAILAGMSETARSTLTNTTAPDIDSNAAAGDRSERNAAEGD